MILFQALLTDFEKIFDGFDSLSMIINIVYKYR